MKGSPGAGEAECRCEKDQVNRAKAAAMSAFVGAASCPFRDIEELWNAELGKPNGEALAVVLVTPLLLLPAIWNRFCGVYSFD